MDGESEDSNHEGSNDDSDDELSDPQFSVNSVMSRLETASTQENSALPLEKQCAVTEAKRENCVGDTLNNNITQVGVSSFSSLQIDHRPTRQVLKEDIPSHVKCNENINASEKDIDHLFDTSGANCGILPQDCKILCTSNDTEEKLQNSFHSIPACPVTSTAAVTCISSNTVSSFPITSSISIVPASIVTLNSSTVVCKSSSIFDPIISTDTSNTSSINIPIMSTMLPAIPLTTVVSTTTFPSLTYLSTPISTTVHSNAMTTTAAATVTGAAATTTTGIITNTAAITTTIAVSAINIAVTTANIATTFSTITTAISSSSSSSISSSSTSSSSMTPISTITNTSSNNIYSPNTSCISSSLPILSASFSTMSVPKSPYNFTFGSLFSSTVATTNTITTNTITTNTITTTTITTTTITTTRAATETTKAVTVTNSSVTSTNNICGIDHITTSSHPSYIIPPFMRRPVVSTASSLFQAQSSSTSCNATPFIITSTHSTRTPTISSEHSVPFFNFSKKPVFSTTNFSAHTTTHGTKSAHIPPTSTSTTTTTSCSSPFHISFTSTQAGIHNFPTTTTSFASFISSTSRLPVFSIAPSRVSENTSASSTPIQSPQFSFATSKTMPKLPCFKIRPDIAKTIPSPQGLSSGLFPNLSSDIQNVESSKCFPIVSKSSNSNTNVFPPKINSQDKRFASKGSEKSTRTLFADFMFSSTARKEETESPPGVIPFQYTYETGVIFERGKSIIVTTRMHSIVCMPPYFHLSQEELQYQFYSGRGRYAKPFRFSAATCVNDTMRKKITEKGVGARDKETQTCDSPLTSPDVMFDLKQVWRVLECPVCLDVVLPPVYQCYKGHHACSGCWKKVVICPLCKERQSQSRNYMAESLIEQIHLPCRYRSEGCKDAVPHSTKLQHEESCAYRLHVCPFELCKQLYSYSAMPDHLSKMHGPVFSRGFSVSKGNNFFNIIYKDNLDFSLIHAFDIPEWGLFLLKQVKLDCGSALFLQVLHASSDVSVYFYNLEVSDSSNSRSERYHGRVFSGSRPVNEIIGEDEYLVVSKLLMKKIKKTSPAKISVTISQFKPSFSLPE